MSASLAKMKQATASDCHILYRLQAFPEMFPGHARVCSLQRIVIIKFSSNKHSFIFVVWTPRFLVKQLEHGYYRDQNNKRRKIGGDYSKLLFSEHLSTLQRKLLQDFRFRCKAIPGTQEIRTKIGHLVFWSTVVYGNGIFMTVSPGERHNYLAIRLSRYRQNDPFMASRCEDAHSHRPWAARDKPSLEPKDDDELNIDIPGYDLRRLILARDPLAAVNAFMIQIRTILATILGMRMCPLCPHCTDTEHPCQDSLGSVAELLGGCAGRADALIGAVEAQKTNGSLHFHFFLFVQRLHQFSTLQEIAELLKASIVKAVDLKRFLANMCVTEYTDLEKFVSEQSSIEANFPTYSDDTTLGRIPAFVFADANPNSVNANYVQEFAIIWQHFQSRCQHHLHKVVDGKRIIPNACKSATHKNECKHGAPWTNRMSPSWMESPLFICKGLAKRFKLACKGSRNWLGQMLPLRNNEWLNGTMPALCVAFAGSNSDVKLNDRLPISLEVHESVCTFKCVQKVHLKQTTRAIQRNLSATGGYFGGYMGKFQPAGRLETRKCIDKMHTLRGKLRGKSQAQQMRSVTGRLMTDLEMNSTFRGAVEVTNLCRHLRSNDVLFAECIRTFGSLVVDGRGWMYRLETTQTASKFTAQTMQTYIPVTKKPNVRTDRSVANDVDVYGSNSCLPTGVHSKNCHIMFC